MAKKNATKSENSNSILFDTRTKTVMAQANQDNIKEMVQSVREVVPGKGTEEIILVLQYHDYSIERTIQAYLEDGAKQALNEWHFSGNKQPKKRKNKNKKAAAPPAVQAVSVANQGEAVLDGHPSRSVDKVPKEAVINGHRLTEPSGSSEANDETLRSQTSIFIASQGGGGLVNRSQPQPQRDQVTHDRRGGKQRSRTPPQRGQTPPAQSVTSQQRSRTPDQRSQPTPVQHAQAAPASRERGISETSSSSYISASSKGRKYGGFEKSQKDLHRQTVSLDRLQRLLNEEVDRASKRIKSVFYEIRNCLSDQENELLKKMEAVKTSASETFAMRKDRAEHLKIQLLRSDQMLDSDLLELRVDIKQFVTDRKIDEEIGYTTRFLYDSDHIMEEIKKFGEVVPVNSNYSTRRPSVSSIASSVLSREDVPVSPLSLVQPPPMQSAASNDALAKPAMTIEEIAELSQRLKTSLQLQGIQPKSPPRVFRPTSGATSSDASQYSSEEARKSRAAKRRQKQRERQTGDDSKGPEHNTSLPRNQSPRKPAGPNNAQRETLGTDNTDRSARPRNQRPPRRDNRPSNRTEPIENRENSSREPRPDGAGLRSSPKPERRPLGDDDRRNSPRRNNRNYRSNSEVKSTKGANPKQETNSPRPENRQPMERRVQAPRIRSPQRGSTGSRSDGGEKKESPSIGSPERDARQNNDADRSLQAVDQPEGDKNHTSSKQVIADGTVNGDNHDIVQRNDAEDSFVPKGNKKTGAGDAQIADHKIVPAQIADHKIVPTAEVHTKMNGPKSDTAHSLAELRDAHLLKNEHVNASLPSTVIANGDLHSD